MKEKIFTENLCLLNAAMNERAENDIIEHILSDSLIDRISDYANKNREELISETHTYISKATAIYAVYKNNNYCGYIVVSERKEIPELGIRISEQFRGKGIGTESVIAFCNNLEEETGIKKIQICILHGNTASIRLFEKLGAVFYEEKLIFEDVRDLLSEEDILQFSIKYYTLDLPIKI